MSSSSYNVGFEPESQEWPFPARYTASPYRKSKFPVVPTTTSTAGYNTDHSGLNSSNIPGWNPLSNHHQGINGSDFQRKHSIDSQVTSNTALLNQYYNMREIPHQFLRYNPHQQGPNTHSGVHAHPPPQYRAQVPNHFYHNNNVNSVHWHYRRPPDHNHYGLPLPRHPGPNGVTHNHGPGDPHAFFVPNGGHGFPISTNGINQFAHHVSHIANMQKIICQDVFMMEWEKHMALFAYDFDSRIFLTGAIHINVEM